MFSRVISLLGEENFSKINEKAVLVVGLGGVGGYAVEALVRSGISNLILIDYDKIVIGSPIWNDRISAPINSVLSLLDLKDKDLSFVFYSASGKGNHAIEKVKNLYGAKSIILKEPKTNKEELKKLKI